MTLDFFTTSIAVLLTWQVLLLIPMVPGKLIDTRDFSGLPRWQFNAFNVFLTSLGLASFVTIGFATIGHAWTPSVAIVLGVLYLAVFFSDLLKIFPVVKDPLPTQLLILEAISLASAGVLTVLAAHALRFM